MNLENHVINNLISIIVPVFNAENFLHTSIMSVLNQSYVHLELLLINDGSTDSSETICSRYAADDKRVRVISQNNSGPAAARNTGLRHAIGEYVFFLDADDILIKNALEVLVYAYNQHHPDLVICNFSKQISKTEILQQRVSFTPANMPFEGDIKTLASADMVAFVRHFLKHPSNHLISYCWARLYKSSTFKTYNISSHEDMRLFEDFVLNLDYVAHADKIVFINKPLYVYVMHNNHISASMAIVQSDSLIHDMNVFKVKAAEFLVRKNDGTFKLQDIEKEIGHALIHYVIIFLVRSCRQITRYNELEISREIEKLVHAPIVSDSLKYYTPSEGNSRLVPILMKLGWVGLLMSLCKYKANKRYGKL